MTDAPERICIELDWEDGVGGWYIGTSGVPYLRADAVWARLAAAERLAKLAPTAIAYLDKYEPVGFTVADEFRAALTEWEAAKGERG